MKSLRTYEYDFIYHANKELTTYEKVFKCLVYGLLCGNYHACLVKHINLTDLQRN